MNTDELMLTIQYCSLVDSCKNNEHSVSFCLQFMAKFEKFVINRVSDPELLKLIADAKDL